MNGFNQLLQSLGTARLLIMSGVAIGLIALIMFMASRIAAPDYSLLYSDLQAKDSAAIIAKLEAANIPFDLKNNGADIFVPEDQVARMRINMAEEGLPNGGSVGYEIFDNSDTFGTTSFVQNLNRVRALEGELSRTIAAIDTVAAARVHLVLPKREVFSREKQVASASIVLKLENAGRLNDSQVSAVQHLVAAAVPSLDPNRISIVDDRGNLLARGDGKNVSGQNGSVSDFKRTRYESRVKEQLEGLLERSLGIGNVRTQVTAVMDFDSQTTKSETYDPDSQVVRSSQSVEESSSSADGSAKDETISVANNLPEADAAGGSSSSSKSDSSRVEETVNYEISKTITTQVRESGIVKRLTVAVLVNGISTTDDDGNTTYEARSAPELEQISKLVKSAIGFDEDRGDLVEIINMPFTQIVTEFEDIPTDNEILFMGLTKKDLFKMGEMGVLVIVAVLALLLVVRPLLNRAMNIEGGVPALAGPAGSAIGGAVGADGQPMIAAGGAADGSMAAIASKGTAGSETLSELDEMIDIAQVEGQVKTSALKKVGDIVAKHPDEAVSIMRNWLYHEA